MLFRSSFRHTYIHTYIHTYVASVPFSEGRSPRSLNFCFSLIGSNFTSADEDDEDEEEG